MPQQRCDAAVAVAAELACQLDDRSSERIFILS